MDTRTKNVLSICSGVGGIELGLGSVIPTRTVCYVENEASVASILAARMEDGSLDSAPIWTDLRTFDPEPWRGKVDILAGGFPCQPHSQAGAQLHGDDPRELSGEVLRIADGLGLPDLFLENVPGILRFYWDNIRPQLRKLGYSLAEGLFTASETGAPHKRERLFILADTDSSEAGRQIRHDSPVWPSEGQTSEPRPGQRGRELAELPLFPPGPNDSRGWEWSLSQWPQLSPTYCKEGHDVQADLSAAPRGVRRVVDGSVSGVDKRLRATGNGVVPIVAALAFHTLGRGRIL